jgi:hypothetical protein
VRLLSSLPTDTELFVDLNDQKCPLLLSSADPLGYKPIQTIRYSDLDFNGPEPHYQTLKFFTQESGTNPKASRYVKFPVYGVYENKPDDSLSRHLPSVTIKRFGGDYIDNFTITPRLDFTIPALVQPLNNVIVTIYLNGFEPGTNVPKSTSLRAPITQFGANSANIAAGVATSLFAKFSDVAGFTRDLEGHHRNFYLEYEGTTGTTKFYSMYPTAKMATG